MAKISASQVVLLRAEGSVEVIQEPAMGAEMGCPSFPPPLPPGQSARLQCTLPLVLLLNKEFKMGEWTDGQANK